MTQRFWRVFHRDFSHDPFDGEGARRVGGRWNSEGIPIVYCSGSLSLAILEILVNAGSPLVLKHYSAIPAEISGTLIAPLAEKDLPAAWNTDPAPFRARTVGDQWIAAGSSPVLEVPSAIVPLEKNYLINPRHPAFGKIKIGTPIPLPMDARLLGWRKVGATNKVG